MLQNSHCKRILSTVVAAAMLLGACAKQPPPGTNDQVILRDYADSYSYSLAQALGLAAAIAGCGIGIITAEDSQNESAERRIQRRIERCLVGAAIGGTVGVVAGAIGGQVIAANQKVYATEEARLNALNAAAEQELSVARRATSAAKRVVDGHKRSLAALQREAAGDTAAAERLRSEIAAAEFDREQMIEARKGMSDQVEILSAEAQKLPALRRRRDALRDEVGKLDTQIGVLTGAIEQAERIS